MKQYKSSEIHSAGAPYDYADTLDLFCFMCNEGFVGYKGDTCPDCGSQLYEDIMQWTKDTMY